MRNDEGHADLLARLHRGVAYIEGRLDRPVQLAEVAKAAALSSYHFHRLFRARYGIPVMGYARARKLAIAAERLVQEKVRVVDIALDLGFESQAAFTRAFRRVFGIPPGEFRKSGKKLPWKSVGRLDESTRNVKTKGMEMESRMESRESFKVAGLLKEFTAETRADIPELWGKFVPQMGKAPRRVGNESFGVCIPKEAGAEGDFGYMACVQVAGNQPLPEGWVEREIPAGKYVVFTHRGPISKFTNTVNYLWGTWLPTSKLRLRKAPDLEVYDRRFQGESPESEVEIWVPVE